MVVVYEDGLWYATLRVNGVKVVGFAPHMGEAMNYAAEMAFKRENRA